MIRAAVLNAGGWGTALSMVLSRRGHETSLWCRREEHAREIQSARENPRYLPGVKLGDRVRVTADLRTALMDADVVVFAPISRGVRDLARAASPYVPPEALVVHGTKGLEVGSLLRVSQVIESELGDSARRSVAALSGPTHAEEVGRGIPTATVIACADTGVAEQLQRAFNCAELRVYTNADVVGVELCGSLKNVVAIAAGISDGIGGGDNAKAALMTRSLAEIGRLVVAAGGRAETVAGLAGIGDLVATCTSRHSRNRRAGELIGSGRPVAEVIQSTPQVVEGIPATQAAVRLAARLGVEMPIAGQLHAILFEEKPPRQAIAELMGREPTAER
ncbi:MAG: NAD(P)H-dependent glycerol-3-phosphate dehydrogenase [Chloroflexota bacterium]